MQYIGESDHMAWVVRDVMKEKIESRKKNDFMYKEFCFQLN